MILDLSIITVTYYSREYIERCLLSIPLHILNCTYEHIIVDNGSTDGTIELIEHRYSNYVHFIKNTQNLGFAAANNQAIQQAKGRYLLFLNPDMELYEGYLDTLIAWMDKRPDIGITGCKLLCPSKVPSMNLRPHKLFSLFSMLPWLLNLRTNLVHHKFLYSHFDDDMEQEVETVRGSFMMMRKDIVEKLGFAFDPAYFILMEDTDLFHEVRRLGYKTMYVPCMSCIDYFGRSFDKHKLNWIYFRTVKSLKIYARKWHSPLHLIWLDAAIYLGFLLRIPRLGLKAKWKALTKKKSAPCD